MRVVSYRDLVMFAVIGLAIYAVYSFGSVRGYAKGSAESRDRIWAACHEPGNMECPAYNGGGGVDKAYVR